MSDQVKTGWKEKSTPRDVEVEVDLSDFSRAELLQALIDDSCITREEAAISGLSDVLNGEAVIVPNEATDEMYAAGSVYTDTHGAIVDASAVYDAMVEASPYRRADDN